MNVRIGYDYDDLLLVPKSTDIASRSDVRVCDVNGFYPIISSPMKGISGFALVRSCEEARIYGTLHRFDTFENRIKSIDSFYNSVNTLFGVAVGLGDEELRIANYAFEHGAEYVCVDVANGGLKIVADFVEKLRANNINSIMAGCVATRESADILYEAGANYIRVGIGGGSLCSTRNVTGVGVPDLTAIEDISLSKYNHSFYLVADGGIRNSGNAVKAFAAGADYIILGSYLAQALEAEHDGNIFGMASRKAQEIVGKEIKSVEGIEQKVVKTAPLKRLVEDFVGGIRSACTYLNCRDYKDLRYDAEWVTTGKGSLKNL